MAQLKDLLVSGAARFINGVFVNGDSSFNNVNPNITDTYSLGTSSLRWNNLYAKNIYTAGLTSTGDILPSGSHNIGSSTSKWNSIYATTVTATTFTGSFSGNSSSATKLATARTIQTNLASTSAASFDGTANITPGVSGTLAVTNGGTGRNSWTASKILYTSSATAIGELGYTSANTANYIVQRDGSGNFSAGTITAALNGNANTASKLYTARTIAIGTGATGTATSFDGSANITIPITSLKEAYVDWGGRNLSGTFTPIDAALIPVLGANRLAGFKAAGTTVEYSTDGGSTWTDYGLTDDAKIGLFTNSENVCIGGPNAVAGDTTVNNKIRVTIDGVNGGVYTGLKKIAIYLSTNGSSDSTVTMESASYSAPTTFSTVISNQALSGWSGWNILNFSLPGTGNFGGTNSNSHQKIIRLTFSNTSCSTSYTGLTISKIYGYGGMGWSEPSYVAQYGTPYTYDNSFNIQTAASLYPSATNTYNLGYSNRVWANVYATNFVGNASSASRLNITSTDNAIARFNGTNGTIQNSGVFIDDNNNVTVPNSIYLNTTATRAASNQSLYINGWQAVTGYDAWLRLNSENKFTSGVYTPGNFRADGTTSIRTLNHINANIAVDGSWTTGTTGAEGNGTTAGTLGTNILTLGNSTAQDNAETTSGAGDGTKTGKNNSRGIFRIYGPQAVYVQEVFDNVALQVNKPFCVLADNKMSISSGKVVNLGTQQTRIYSDGIAISNPATANDVGWMRVLGTGESDTVYEIATGDDAEAGESIVARQYNTSSAVTHETTIMDHTGSFIFNSGTTPTTNTTNLFTINGHVIINPAYNTNNNQSETNYSEGIRLNLGSNNWSTIALGGANGSSTGTAVGIWLVGVQHSTDTDGNAVGNFYISHYGSNSASTRLQGNANGFIIYPRVGINGENTGYNFYVNGTSYFNGNTTHNGIDYFANGTTYYINNNADAKLRYLALGGLDPTSSYQLYVNGTSQIKGTVWTRQVVPDTTNLYSSGSSSYRWSGVYIGTANGYGSATNPIYWSTAGVPTACTYDLKATVNNATQWGVAYYSTATNITSTAAGDDGSFLQATSTKPVWITGVNAANYLINCLSEVTSAPKDADYYIAQYTDGGTTTTTYHRKAMSTLWTYIKSKLSTDDTATYAGSTAKVAESLTFSTAGDGVASTGSYNGSAATKISYNTIGAAAASHTHSYAGSASVGGAANSVANAITFTNVAANGAASGTTYNGSSAVTVSCTTVGAKPTQTAVTDPTASGTSLTFISTISQNANGVITPTKATVQSASDTQSGIVTIETQSFAGAKTFTGTSTTTTFQGSVAITGGTDSSSTTTGTLKVTGGIGASGNIYGYKVYNAVWNDYAEYRESDCVEPGYVIQENGDDTLSKTRHRLDHFAGIISDTFGTAMGGTDKCKSPIAVAGRVLAYTYQDRNNYKPGDCVCAAPNGTVDIMTREEVINYPDRMIGTVSCVPTYDTWGSGNVKINNRIWIKIK